MLYRWSTFCKIGLKIILKSKSKIYPWNTINLMCEKWNHHRTFKVEVDDQFCLIFNKIEHESHGEQKYNKNKGWQYGTKAIYNKINI